MVRLLLGLTTFGTHVVNGFFTDYENTEGRPIFSWIKSLDMVRISRSGFLGGFLRFGATEFFYKPCYDPK